VFLIYKCHTNTYLSCHRMTLTITVQAAEGSTYPRISMYPGGRRVFSLEGVSTEVAAFITACQRLLAALPCHSTCSEPEKEMISYYCQEIMSQTQRHREELREM
jgi:hypothetical protein